MNRLLAALAPSFLFWIVTRSAIASAVMFLVFFLAGGPHVRIPNYRREVQ